MTSGIELQYLFDPFCGWCYASAPALAGLAEEFGDSLKLLPSGLFVGGRPISSIADHAWRNDQRIQALTGQKFTDAYHRRILMAPDGVFDSGPATLALIALGEEDSGLEPHFLHAVQIARYVEGRDTASINEVAKVAVQVASRHGVELTADAFAERLRGDVDLQARCSQRIDETKDRMNSLGVRGVPQLVVIVNGMTHALDGEVLYQGPQKLIAAMAALHALN